MAIKCVVENPAALLVIDVQQALFRSVPPPESAASVVENINRLAAAARRASVRVILMQHDGEPDEGLVPGTPGWQLYDELVRGPRDVVLRKTTCDAFYRTALEAELQLRQVRTLVITGYATDFCIDATVRSACSRSLRVIVGADAHTTNDNPVLSARKVIEHHNWAWANAVCVPRVMVTPTDQIAFTASACV